MFIYVGCTKKIREKIVPLLTETGPNGHVEDCRVDFEFKAVRWRLYARDDLVHEFVIPLDVDAPFWGFDEKFTMV